MKSLLHDEVHAVAVISADELREKMIARGLIATAQAEAPAQEAPQQAAA